MSADGRKKPGLKNSPEGLHVHVRLEHDKDVVLVMLDRVVAVGTQIERSRTDSAPVPRAGDGDLTGRTERDQHKQRSSSRRGSSQHRLRRTTYHAEVADRRRMIEMSEVG